VFQKSDTRLILR